MSKKLSYKYVKDCIEKEDYQLLSDTYTNSKTKLLVKCPKGHEYQVNFNHFRNGVRCRECSYKKRGNALKEKWSERKINRGYTYEYVKEYIESFGYKLLSETYINAKQKLLLRCPEGHLWEIMFSNIKSMGFRCRKCSYKKRGDMFRTSYNDVKNYMLKFDQYLISEIYNNKEKLKIKCGICGYVYKKQFASFKSGHMCPQCGIKKRSMSKRYTYQYVKEYIESFGYGLLSETYNKCHEKLLVKCPEGHEYEVRFYAFKQGQRCPFCSNNTSKGEIELQDYIESLGYDIIRNNRTEIINPLTNKNLELDIWIPNLNKAIEYNGTYWHSLNERIKCDSIKKDQCIQRNIDLLIVSDEKWINNNNIEKERVEKWLLK